MAKYHLKQDGTPARCTADVRACPRDGESEHYESEEQARQAYEVSMSTALVAVPASKGRRTILDRLMGRSEEEAARHRVNEDFFALRHNLFMFYQPDRTELRELYDAAEHYDVFRAEATVIVKQGLAIQDKIKEIEATAKTMLKENPKAFTPGLDATVGYLNDWNGYGHTAIPRIFEPGEDSGVHRTLMPMLEKLVSRRLELRSEYSQLQKEAERLTVQVKKEGNMSPEQRSAVSAQAKAMYDRALAPHEDIPAPEMVEDRRAWAQSREDAVEELQQRGVL